MPVDAANPIGSTEACELIGIDRSTLTRWVQVGKITPLFRLAGGAMLFDPADVEKRRAEYVAERSTEVVEAAS